MPRDWNGNSFSASAMLAASNRALGEREKDDYYATEPSAIDDLLAVETFSNQIWECACGEGHLAKRLIAEGYSVKCTDLIDRGYGKGGIDFLKQTDTFNGDIITNPPYKYVSEFVLKALELIPDGRKVAMFLKLQTLEGQKRYEDIYSKYPPKTIYVYSKRKNCAKNGDFENITSSAVCYAWFIWVKGFVGNPEIKWIYNKGDTYEN